MSWQKYKFDCNVLIHNMCKDDVFWDDVSEKIYDMMKGNDSNVTNIDVVL